MVELYIGDGKWLDYWPYIRLEIEIKFRKLDIIHEGNWPWGRPTRTQNWCLWTTRRCRVRWTCTVTIKILTKCNLLWVCLIYLVAKYNRSQNCVCGCNVEYYYTGYSITIPDIVLLPVMLGILLILVTERISYTFCPLSRFSY